jgi:SAM-dependent methyltransferase
MGDRFRREAASSPEPFTGERLTSAIGGQVQIEHYHRYLFARALCDGLDVLDVASGEGYGAAQLAQVARSVVGVEYDAATVAGAAGSFRRDNLTYVQGDARALPLPDACVDVAVSFETIEHFDRQAAFVAEIRRVLRPSGIFIVSTPDRDVYSGPGIPPNPYHVAELSPPEFLDLLRPLFAHVALLRQRPLIGSAMLADTPAAGLPLVFERMGLDGFERHRMVPRAPYLIAVASGRALPDLPPSLYIERGDLDTDAHDLRLCAAARAQAEAALAAARESEAALTARIGALAAALSAAETSLLEAGCLHAEASRIIDTERVQAAAMAQAHAAALAQAGQELEAVRGSARTFLRFYLPRLRRHLRNRARAFIRS